MWLQNYYLSICFGKYVGSFCHTAGGKMSLWVVIRVQNQEEQSSGKSNKADRDKLFLAAEWSASATLAARAAICWLSSNQQGWGEASECERRDDSLGCFSFPVLGILLLLKLKHSLKKRQRGVSEERNQQERRSIASEWKHSQEEKKPDKNKQAVPNFYYRAEYISQQCALFCFLLIQPIVSYIPQKKSWMVIQQQKVTSLECGCSRRRCEPTGLLITAVY